MHALVCSWLWAHTIPTQRLHHTLLYKQQQGLTGHFDQVPQDNETLILMYSSSFLIQPLPGRTVWSMQQNRKH